MAEKRIILEMGSGTDLYGGDYTKAACRAVHNALQHSSIGLFKSLGIDHREMRVQVTIGVQEPSQVDVARVCAELPRGRAEVTAVHGGLNVHDDEQNNTHVIATAAKNSPVLTKSMALSSGRIRVSPLSYCRT